MKMRTKDTSRIIYLCVFLATAISSVFVISCNKDTTIDRRMTDANKLIQSNPDSALFLLEEIQDNYLTSMSEKQKAYLSMYMAKAKISQDKTFLTDDTFDSSIKYLETIDDTLGLVEMYQLAAIKHRWIGQQDSATTYLKKAINLIPDSESQVKSSLYVKLSNLYAYPSLKKDYHKALKYAQIALSTANRADNNARALHDIGLFYSYANQNDSAILFLEKAISEADPKSPDFSTYVLNYANSPNADFNRSRAYLNKIKGKHLGKFVTLGFIFLNNAIPDSAKHYLAESKKIYSEDPSKYSLNTYNNIHLLEQSIKLLETGIVSLESTTNDSISTILEIQNKLSSEQRDHNNKLEIRLLESKSRRQLMLIVSLGILLLMSIGFGIFIWHTKRRYLKLKKQLDNVKIEQIVVEASESVNEADTSLSLIKERMNICIEQFRVSKLQGEIDKMELQYRNTDKFPPIKNRETLQKGLIACFADFIVDLKMTGVKLNLDDIVTCIMSCLHETNMSIAACLGTTDTAVRTRKTRLRAKLPAGIIDLLDL